MHHLIFFKSQIDSEFVTIFLLLCIFFLSNSNPVLCQSKWKSICDWFYNKLRGKKYVTSWFLKKKWRINFIFLYIGIFIHVCFGNIIILMRHFIYPSKKHLTFIFIRQLVYGIVVNLTKFFVTSICFQIIVKNWISNFYTM